MNLNVNVFGDRGLPTVWEPLFKAIRMAWFVWIFFLTYSDSFIPLHYYCVPLPCASLISLSHPLGPFNLLASILLLHFLASVLNYSCPCEHGCGVLYQLKHSSLVAPPLEKVPPLPGAFSWQQCLHLLALLQTSLSLAPTSDWGGHGKSGFSWSPTLPHW